VSLKCHLYLHTVQITTKKAARCFNPTGRVHYIISYFYLVQISRLPAGLSNRPPPTKQIASANPHYLIIISYLFLFVNT
jgi:hypothetical protein